SVSKPATAPEECSVTDSLRPPIKDPSISLPVEDSLPPTQPSIKTTPGNTPTRTTLPQSGNNSDSTNR
ncbi:MAG: hypothetical protein AAFY76_01455, partial [Cyanobacteria bacterium J06649_11]